MATIYTELISSETEEKKDWQRAFDVYFTSGNMKDKEALNTFKKENTDNYTSRKENVAVDNTYDTEVNSISEKVFIDGRIVRSTLSEEDDLFNPEIREIALDIDGAGTDVNSFFENNAKLARVMGTTLLLWDNERDVPETQDEMNRGYLPTARIFTPLDLVVYGKNDKGQLEYVKFPVQKVSVNQLQISTGDLVSNQVYRVYRRNEGSIEIYETTHQGAPDVIKTSNNTSDDGERTVIKSNVTVWPICECRFNIPEKTYKFANSKDRKVHSIEEMRLNMNSWLNEILKNNTFPIWTENREPQDKKSGQKRETGSKVAVMYGKGYNAPAFVAPPSDPAEIIMKQIDRYEQQVNKNMGAMSAIEAGSSSDTRKMADELRTEQLQRVAMYSQMWETLFMNICLRAFYTRNYEYVVSYPKKFASMTGDLVISELLLMFDAVERLNLPLDKSTKVKLDLFNNAFEKIDPNNTETIDFLKSIYEELDTNSLVLLDPNGNDIDDIEDETDGTV